MGDLMSHQIAAKHGHSRISTFPKQSSFLSARSNALLINKHLPGRSRIVFLLQQEAVPLAIVSALLLTTLTLGWIVLHSLSAGTRGLEIRVNWTAIVALGVPLVIVAFLLVWLVVRVAQWQSPHDTVS